MRLILSLSYTKKNIRISMLTEGNSSNVDAIAALSDQVMKLTKEIEMIKKDKITITSL